MRHCLTHTPLSVTKLTSTPYWLQHLITKLLAPSFKFSVIYLYTFNSWRVIQCSLMTKRILQFWSVIVAGLLISLRISSRRNVEQSWITN
jgi:hypothetical protein